MTVSQPDTLRDRRQVLIVLWLVILAGCALRLLTIGRSYWVDEILSHRIAALSLADAAGTVYYPLTYVLMHFALRLGDCEVAGRLPSLVAGILMIPVIYRVGAQLHSRAAGLLAALLVAASPMHVQYSQEARFYSIMALAALLTVWTLWRVLHGGALRWWLGYVGSVVLGSLTHPMYLPFLAGACCCALAWRLMSRVGQGARLLVSVLLIVATVAGLIPAGAAYWHRVQSQPERSPLAGAVPSESRSLLLEPVQYSVFQGELLILGVSGPQDTKRGLPFALVMLVPTVCMVAGAVWLVRRRRPFAAIVLGAALQPVPFFFVSVGHWYASKYFIAQLPLGLLLLSIGVLWGSRRVACLCSRRSSDRGGLVQLLAVIALVAGFAPFGIESLLAWYRLESKTVPWPECARIMSRHMTGRDLIVHMPSMTVKTRARDVGAEPTLVPMSFYLERQVPKGRFDLVPSVQVGADDSVELARVLKQAPDANVWLVRRHWDGARPLAPELDRLFSTMAKAPNRHLLVAGAPAENLASTRLVDYPTTGSVESAKGMPFPVGGRCLRLVPTIRSIAAAGVRIRIPEDTTSSAGRAGHYVLSALVKAQSVFGDMRTTAGACLTLVRHAESGKGSRTTLATWSGTWDWRFVSFPVTADPGDEVVIEFSVGGEGGVFWVDKVQLEAGDFPTPFVDGVRPRRELAAVEGRK